MGPEIFIFDGLNLSCSQDYGPPLVICYIMAPIIQGYQNWTLVSSGNYPPESEGFRFQERCGLGFRRFAFFFFGRRVRNVGFSGAQNTPTKECEADSDPHSLGFGFRTVGWPHENGIHKAISCKAAV